MLFVRWKPIKVARNAETTNNVKRMIENKEKRQIDKSGTIRQWIGIKENPPISPKRVRYDGLMALVL